MQLSIHLESLPVKGGEDFLRALFEPLGYEVQATQQALDEQFPSWGDSPYFSLKLNVTKTLSEVLNHLYVLIPVFDNQKHYFVGRDEIEKLLLKGEGWLADHPCKDVITRRYLRHQGGMVRQALETLRANEGNSDTDEIEEVADAAEAASEAELSAKNESDVTLNEQRHQAVAAELAQAGASSVIDLGCGEGKLLRRLLGNKQFHKIVGMDVSVRVLEIAARRLRLESLPDPQARRIRLIHGSLMYRDERLAGFDMACLVEVIEHLDPPRLSAMQQVVFQYARPGTVIVTTPNAEYNVIWKSLPAGKFRHSDHRFEWTRAEFEKWSTGVAQQHGYNVRFSGIGPEAENVGTPTQMAVFTIESSLRERAG